MTHAASQAMTLQQWLDTVAPTIGASGPDYLMRGVAMGLRSARIGRDMVDALCKVEFRLRMLEGRGSSFADGVALVRASLELYQPLDWWELEQQ